ncbi:hypothetical protein HZA73_10500 [candidate division TA06 bacterium]|nr:hypothetical protein [candidate division TA06 bacterium]
MNDEKKQTVSLAGSKISRPVFNALALVLVAALLNLTLGCTGNPSYVRRNEVDSEVQSMVINQGKSVYLHTNDDILHLSWVTAKDSVFSAKAIGTADNFVGYYLVTNRDGSSTHVNIPDPNMVDIYVTKYDKDSLGNISFKFSDVRKVLYSVSEIDIASSIVAGAGIGLCIFVLIALSAKGESCPFIYAYENGQYKFIGEIYSGATYPSLERHDYLALGGLQPTDGQYRIKIANKVKEIQHTNLAELVVVDHPRDTKVVMDKNGACQTMSKIQAPVQAVNLRGKDVRLELSNQDTISYSGEGAIESQTETDGVVLTFDRPAGAGSAKLLLRAKNNLWIDYTFKRFHELFGSYYHKWEDRQLKVSGDSISSWMAAQGVFLQVFLKKNGVWERVDQFNLPGPMAYREDVLALDISGADPGPLEVKLEAGTLFWELDYAGIDFSSNTDVKTTVVPITQAITDKGIDVAPLLAADDGKYYSQPQIGDEAVLTFAAPAEAGMSRSVFLHSKGHYKILQDPKGRPDRKYLEAFLQPGRLNRFSLELLSSGLQGIKN